MRTPRPSSRRLANLPPGQADLAVLHGQTFFHWVDDAGRALGTLQLGNSAEVAERTGMPVICDLRSRDLVAGGQAAPMVAMFDQLLLAGRPGPSAAVNLGGIANLSSSTRRTCVPCWTASHPSLRRRTCLQP